MQRGRRLVFLQWRSSQIKSPPRDVRDLSLSFTKFSFVSFSENRSPPSTQSHLERWSLVFFTRPGNSVPLEALVRDSSMIAAAVDGNKEKNFNTAPRARSWGCSTSAARRTVSFSVRRPRSTSRQARKSETMSFSTLPSPPSARETIVAN